MIDCYIDARLLQQCLLICLYTFVEKQLASVHNLFLDVLLLISASLSPCVLIVAAL